MLPSGRGGRRIGESRVLPDVHALAWAVVQTGQAADGAERLGEDSVGVQSAQLLGQQLTQGPLGERSDRILLPLAMQDEPPVVLVGADDGTVGKRDAHLVDRGAARLVHWDVEAEARGEPTGK